MLKIAVVGIGINGRNHINAIKNLDDCALCAVCDINEDAATKAAAEFGIPYFTNYKDIVSKTEAEAVILNLPHWLHCEVTEFFWSKVCMFW